MDYIKFAHDAIQIEIDGLVELKGQVDDEFNQAVKVLKQCTGRVVVCGMGKSGLIAQKIVATLNSTGTPAIYLHPGDAFHGDLGMVVPSDVFLALSYSGETEEVIRLIPYIKENNNSLIAITGSSGSMLAQQADIHLSAHVSREACPLQLAPTASTTAALVLGDALAVTLMKLNSFEEENFARFHPGGSLGKRLLVKVRDRMISDDLPSIASTATFLEIVDSVQRSAMGLTVVQDDTCVVGVISDGDLRRAMHQKKTKVFDITADLIMTREPKFINEEAKLAEAIELMHKHNITVLLVGGESELAGMLPLFSCE